jgi:hypothetical protein
MATASQEKAEAGKSEAAKTPPEPIIIDLGKQKRSKVRRLRKGRGPLFAKVLETHEELRAQEVVDSSARPIIVVVNAKKRGRRWRTRFW